MPRSHNSGIGRYPKRSKAAIKKQKQGKTIELAKQAQIARAAELAELSQAETAKSAEASPLETAGGSPEEAAPEESVEVDAETRQELQQRNIMKKALLKCKRSRKRAAADTARAIKRHGLEAAKQLLTTPKHPSEAAGFSVSNRAAVFAKPWRTGDGAIKAACRQVRLITTKIKCLAKVSPLQAAAALGGAARDPDVRFLLPQAGILLPEDHEADTHRVVVDAKAVDEEEGLAVMAMKELEQHSR